MNQKPSFHHPILKCITSFIPLLKHSHRNNLKTKATLQLCYPSEPYYNVCAFGRGLRLCLSSLLLQICDCAGIEQKVSSSNLPGLLRLVYLIERDFMHIYSPKFNFITLLQYKDNDRKTKSSWSSQMTHMPHPQIIVRAPSLQLTE